MPDILLLGATGFTGALTARSLVSMGADFAVAGRNRAKLEKLSREVGDVEVRVVPPGSVDALVAALEDVGVLITCVGPFVELGDVAVEAALRAQVHYVDCAGEAQFVERLIAQYSERARGAGVTLAPALGFEEVVADVAATLATRGIVAPELVLTYVPPRRASRGTLRSALGVIPAPTPWIEDGRRRMVRPAQEQRWAPMPAPLGPRLGISFLFPEIHLAPLHLDLHSLKLFLIIGSLQRRVLEPALPVLRLASAARPVRAAFGALVAARRPGPHESAREADNWMVLAEARGRQTWRNVALQGQDAYGLTARSLSATGMKMLEPGYGPSGVVAPVQALGLHEAQKLLADQRVNVLTFGLTGEE